MALSSYVHDHHLIGGGSTLLVFSIPTADSVLALVGKFAFTILTAVVASYISGKVRSWSDARKKDK